jgi:hypothetical protein
MSADAKPQEQAMPQNVSDPNQALTLLVQAVNLAQSRGVYTLDEAALLAQAVKFFVRKEEETPEQEQSSEQEQQQEQPQA